MKCESFQEICFVPDDPPDGKPGIIDKENRIDFRRKSAVFYELAQSWYDDTWHMNECRIYETREGKFRFETVRACLYESDSMSKTVLRFQIEHPGEKLHMQKTTVAVLFTDSDSETAAMDKFYVFDCLDEIKAFRKENPEQTLRRDRDRPESDPE